MAEPLPEHTTSDPDPSDDERPAVGQTGARFAESPSVDEDKWAVEETDWDSPEQTFDLVRPYAWTRGRTAGRRDLAIEALVSASQPGPDLPASPEHQAILGLCRTPRSVAELAALLSVPLGVARVVLGDMAEAGSVVVHRTVGSIDGTPDFALMQRVLTCLQRL
jgi:hypothetical protein